MSTFTERLAARSLGVADVIRPRLPSLFEPGGPAVHERSAYESVPDPFATDIAVSPEKPEVAVPRRAVQAPLDAIAGSPPESSTPAAGAIVVPVHHGASQPAPAVAAAPQPRVSEWSESRQAVGQPRRPDGRIAAETPRVQPVAGAGKVHAATQVPASVRAESTVVRRLNTTAAAQTVRAAEAAAAPASTVHVTIGRIEVRAVTAPSSRAASRTQPRVMSLNEYFRRRTAGDRE
jgi:hypothetical protein